MEAFHACTYALYVGGAHCVSGMADREYNVYQAKLAEQAERYDGKVRTSD